jgi:g-D-glutamyl-meso-diaminopimelate peptidase
MSSKKIITLILAIALALSVPAAVYAGEDPGSDSEHMPGLVSAPEPVDRPDPLPLFIPDPEKMKAKLVSNPYIKPTYARMMKDIKKLRKQYPVLVDYSYIGESLAGVQIPMVTLGVGKTKVLITASLHAREFVTTSQVMRSIDTYAKAYAEGTKIDGINVRNVLNDDVTYCFVPMANPDGVAIAQGKANAKQKALAVSAVGKKVYKKYYKLWKGNARAVNLNRNFPVKWADQSRSAKRPSYDMYSGPSGGSEVETQMLMKLCEENDFAFMISAHTRGSIINWDDSYSGRIAGAKTLATAIRNITGYRLAFTSSKYNGGRFEKWFRYNTKKPGIVVEFTAYNQNYHTANKNFDNAVWKRSKSLWLKLYKYAK